MQDTGAGSVIKLSPDIAADEATAGTTYQAGDSVGPIYELYQHRTWNALKALREYSPMHDLALPDDLTGTASDGSTTTLQCAQTEYRQFTYTTLTGDTPVVRTYTNGYWTDGDGVDWNAGGDTGELVYHNATDKVMVVRCDDNSSALDTDDTVVERDSDAWNVTGLSNVYTFPTESIYGIYPGMVVYHGHAEDMETNPAMACVSSNSGTVVTLDQALRCNGESFATGHTSYFRIKREVLARTFFMGKVQFWIIDIRNKGDRQQIDGRGLPGADWLDGTREWVNPKISGTASSTVSNQLAYSTGGFSAVVVDGDVVVNKDVFRITTCSASGTLVADDSVTWQSGSGEGVVLENPGTNVHGQDEIYIRRTAGPDPDYGDEITDGSDSVTVWGDIRNEAAVVKVNGNHTDTALELETYWGSGTGKDLFASGDDFEVYESGGSSHGSRLANEKAGHIQREWLVNGINDSEAAWKIIVCETPFHGTVAGSPANQYQLLPTIDPLDCLRQYLISEIDYANVFMTGADQHFGCLDDGRSSFPRFACMNVAPLYGRYATYITHAPDIETWKVRDGGLRKYAAWGDDQSSLSGFGATRMIWNKGAFGLLEFKTQNLAIASIYGFDGNLIDNNDKVVSATAIDSISPDHRVNVAGTPWVADAYIGSMLYFVSEDKQYPITDNGDSWVESTGADFSGYTGNIEIYDRPYTSETDTDYLGELTMEISETLYHLINETFDTPTGTGSPDGCDEFWTLEQSDA
jgi:hypothetical protein